MMLWVPTSPVCAPLLDDTTSMESILFAPHVTSTSPASRHFSGSYFAIGRNSDVGLGNAQESAEESDHEGR